MRIIKKEEIKNKIIEKNTGNRKDNILSDENLSCLIRRAASILCPCTPNMLVMSIVKPLEIYNNESEIEEKVLKLLEKMIESGEIIQSNDENMKETVRIIPPTYIRVVENYVYIMGGQCDNNNYVPDIFRNRIEYYGHLRRIKMEKEEEYKILEVNGFVELSLGSWLKMPKKETYESYKKNIDKYMDERIIEKNNYLNVKIIETCRKVDWYKGRWTDSKGKSGRYVGRRERKYGPDLWCYFEIKNGLVKKLVDLPIRDLRWRACDEAWRLQMAIDACNGANQKYTIKKIFNNSYVIKYFSPLPLWYRRRMQFIGVERKPEGCMISFEIKEENINEEKRICEEYMWLKQAEGE